MPPPVIDYLDANPDHILQGECTDLSWSFSGEGLALAQLFRDNTVLLTDVPFTGTYTDCPPSIGEVEYRLKVDAEFTGSAEQSAHVQVSVPEEQPPQIDLFEVEPGKISLFACFDLRWRFSGSGLAYAAILRNGEELFSDIPRQAVEQDCIEDPALIGSLTYTLKVDSESSGSAEENQTVEVSKAR